MTLGPFGRELRKPFPRDRLKAVRSRNFRRTLRLFLVFTWIDFIPQEPLSFCPLLARHGQCYGWERAECQPVLPVRKSVFQMPKLRTIGIDLHIQALLIAELVRFLTRFRISYGGFG